LSLSPKSTLLIFLLTILCLSPTRTARADRIGPGGAEVAGVIVAVGALVGVGVYYAVHHGHSLRGCASGHPDGIQLLNEGDQHVYLLGGNVDGVKPGDRVRVSGKKKNNGGNNRQFFVKKLSKDYGPCKVSGSAP
jgi:hypothetical protein